MKTPSTICNPSITIRLTVNEAMSLFNMLARDAEKGSYRRADQQVGCCIRRTIANTHPGLFPACFGYQATELHRMAEIYEPVSMDAPEETEDIARTVSGLSKLYANDKDAPPKEDPLLLPKTVVREIHHHHYPAKHRPHPGSSWYRRGPQG